VIQFDVEHPLVFPRFYRLEFDITLFNLIGKSSILLMYFDVYPSFLIGWQVISLKKEVALPDDSNGQDHPFWGIRSPLTCRAPYLVASKDQEPPFGKHQLCVSGLGQFQSHEKGRSIQESEFVQNVI